MAGPDHRASLAMIPHGPTRMAPEADKVRFGQLLCAGALVRPRMLSVTPEHHQVKGQLAVSTFACWRPGVT